MEDRTWLRDPTHLERQRVLFVDLHARLDANAAWRAEARERLARLERALQRQKTRELGRNEPNDEPLS